MPGGHYCPKCDSELEWEDDDHDVGLIGGWHCTTCDEPVEGEPPSYYED